MAKKSKKGKAKNNKTKKEIMAKCKMVAKGNKGRFEACMERHMM